MSVHVDVDPSNPVGHLMQRIEIEKNVQVHQQRLSGDPAGRHILDPSIPLLKYGIRQNGDVIHLQIDPNAAVLVAGPAMATVHEPNFHPHFKDRHTPTRFS